MSFALMHPSNEKIDFNEGLRVSRRVRSEETDDAFVVYKPMAEDKMLRVSFFSRNGLNC
jgi:hypothetical protein